MLIVSILLFTGSNQVLYYLTDNPLATRSYIISNGITNGTDVNISFEFDRNLIWSNYDISNGERLYTSYINFYIDEFLDNTSIESIPFVTINNQKFQPVNMSYEYSFQIEDDTLMDLSQNIEIEKSDTLNINKIELTYRGIDVENYEFYQGAIYIITIIMFFTSIGLLWSSR